jgi:competence protein ComEC
MTLPLLMYYFSKLSLISLLANLLILPIIPILMTWGFVQMFVSVIFLPLGQICGYLSWLLIIYWVIVAKWLSAMPFSFLILPSFSWWWLILFYLAIFLILRRYRRRT